MGLIDDYLDGLEAAQSEALGRIRDIAMGVAPEAVEGTSYGMVALRQSGRPLIGFTARRGHMSLHPFSPAVVQEVAVELPGYSVSKGTIRFTAESPLPDSVVERIVRLRLAEITGS